MDWYGFYFYLFIFFCKYSQLGAQFILGIFILCIIYQSLCVSSDCVPIIRRNNCVYVTLGTCILDSHPHRITSTKCRINTVVSPDDGDIVARNMWRLIDILRINILRINCTSWLYLQDYTGMHSQHNIKKRKIRACVSVELAFHIIGNIYSLLV